MATLTVMKYPAPVQFKGKDLNEALQNYEFGIVAILQDAQDTGIKLTVSHIAIFKEDLTTHCITPGFTVVVFVTPEKTF